MNLVLPPQYGYGAVYGISDAADNIIQGEVPFEELSSCRRASRLADRAALNGFKLSLPTATSEALYAVFYERQLHRLAGLISLPSSIVHDIFKTPSYLAQKWIALSRLSLERKRAEHDVLEGILESLHISSQIVSKMLVNLSLETSESLKQQTHNGSNLLALARLLEAFGSRFAPVGAVYLASQKWLRRVHCSGTGRLHFDQIHHLKEYLVFVGLQSPKDLPDASARIEIWLPRVWKALNGLSMEGNENQLFCDLVQKLRNTRDELLALILLL